MHGSSSVPKDLQDIINQYGGKLKPTWGVPVEEIQLGIRNGVRKINVDTDNRLAITGAIRKVFAEKPEKFDPRNYLKPAREAMKKVVARMTEFGQAGHAGDYQPIPLAEMAEQYAAGGRVIPFQKPAMGDDAVIHRRSALTGDDTIAIKGAHVTLSQGKLTKMKALANDAGIIAAAAMDQRGSLQKGLAQAKGVDKKAITFEMMAEFKTAVTKVLTPHASAILLDPEYGLGAAKARSRNAGLLLAYEKSGYDNTQPGRLPDLLETVSAKRIVDWGADAVKVLIYYTPFEDEHINDVKHAFIERIGAECEANDIPFFLEFVGYDPKGGDEKGLEYAKRKPEIVTRSMQEFTKPQYKVDVLKVEVPINAQFVEGSVVFKGKAAYSRKEALEHFRRAAAVATKPFIYLSAGREQRAVRGVAADGRGGGLGLLRRAVRPRHVEGRHPRVREERGRGAGGMAES